MDGARHMQKALKPQGQLEGGRAGKRVAQGTAAREGNRDRRGQWLGDPEQAVFEEQAITQAKAAASLSRMGGCPWSWEDRSP